MAIRKATVKAQLETAIKPFLEADEHVDQYGFALTGPNPWLIALTGIIGRLLFWKAYGMVITDRRFIVLKASQWTGKVKSPEWAIPRAGVSVVSFKYRLWSTLTIRRPDGVEMRLNFDRYWKTEAEQIRDALSSPRTAPSS